MVLNEDQEKQIKENVAKIENMGGGQELEAFAQKWHMAKEDLDTSVFSWVLKTIDDKQASFKKQESFGSTSVTEAELRVGEV